MSIIFLKDRLEAINTDHIVRYYKEAEESGRLTVSTHKLLAELVIELSSSDNDGYGYAHNQILFEGTEAECVSRLAYLLNQIMSKTPIITCERTVGTTLGIQEFVNTHCKYVKGSVISAGTAKKVFIGYYDEQFPEYPTDASAIVDGYQHRPYGVHSDNPNGPDTHQFIKWMKDATSNADIHIDTLYESGYFYAFDNYDATAEHFDLDRVFFAHLEIAGTFEPEANIPDEIKSQVAHYTQEATNNG